MDKKILALFLFFSFAFAFDISYAYYLHEIPTECSTPSTLASRHYYKEGAVLGNVNHWWPLQYEIPEDGSYAFITADIDYHQYWTNCSTGNLYYEIWEYCETKAPALDQIPDGIDPDKYWQLIEEITGSDELYYKKCGTNEVLLTADISAYVYKLTEQCKGLSIPNVPSLIRQCDERWDDLLYDNTSSTICDQGCALASLNMLMKSEGCNPDFLTTNDCDECFTSGGGVDWSTLLSSYCNSASYLGSKDYGEFKTVESVIVETNFNVDIKNGYKYILRVKNKYGACNHFVFLTGVSSDCKSFNVLDPGGIYNGTINAICGYRKFK